MEGLGWYLSGMLPTSPTGYQGQRGHITTDEHPLCGPSNYGRGSNALGAADWT